MEKKRSNVLLGDLMILAVAFIWGVTAVVIRGALREITPLWFTGLRFLFASAALCLLFGRRAARASAKTKITAALTGGVFTLAYLIGAIGLLYTTAGNQSFIVSMSVVFVPLGVWLLTGKFPGLHIVLSVVLCAAGMAGLVLDASFSVAVNKGDLLSFVTMLCVSAYILLVQKFARGADPYALACWQTFGGTALAVSAALFFEPLPAGISSGGWLAIGYAGTVGFALTVVLQNTAQTYTTATHTAILLSTSSVFGSALGVLFLGEPMTARILVSSALILAGVVAAEAIPAMRKT